MIRSMTGFGEGEAERGGFRVRTEIRTVNHRFCDVKMRLPNEIAALESDIRKRVQDRIVRGRVDLSMVLERHQDPVYRVKIDKPLVDRYLAAARQLKKQFHLEGEVTLPSVMQVPGAVRLEVDRRTIGTEESEVLFRALDRALDTLDRARRKEGAHLRRDLRKRLDRINRLRRTIAKGARGAPDRIARRLRERIEALLADRNADPDRIVQEAAFLADRSDVTEELVRLEAHVAQATQLLDGVANEAGQKAAPGKRLDFLLQEMNREANTIGSKASDLGITREVVEVKAEIEKIREQVQNLE